MQGSLDSNSFNSGEVSSASAAGTLCAASPLSSEEAPTVNGGQSDSYSENMDREPEPELAEEVSENGPLLGLLAVAFFSLSLLLGEKKAWKEMHIFLLVQLMAEGNG